MNPKRKECKQLTDRWYVYESDDANEIFHYHPNTGERLFTTTPVYGGPVIAICSGCGAELTADEAAGS